MSTIIFLSNIPPFQVKGEVENFKIYDFDSVSTITYRLASTQKILPEHLSYISGFEDKKEIKFYSLKNTLQNSTVDTAVKWFASRNSSNGNLVFPNLTGKELAVWYWYFNYSAKLPDPYEVDNFDKKMLAPNHVALHTFKSDFSSQRSITTKKLEKERKTIEDDEEVFEQFENIQGLKSSSIQILKTKIKIVFNVHFDIYQAFNLVPISVEVPFVLVNRKYYKVLKNFIPPIKWTYQDEKYGNDFEEKETMSIKLLNASNNISGDLVSSVPELKRSKNSNLDNNFSNVIVNFTSAVESERRGLNKQFEIDKLKKLERLNNEMQELNKSKTPDPDKIKDIGKQIITVRESRHENLNLLDSDKNIDLNTHNVNILIDFNNSKDLTEAEIVSRTLKLFPENRFNEKTETSSVKGAFIIAVPEKYSGKFNKNIFMFMVMNENLLQKFFTVDDNVLRRGDGGTHVIYFPNVYSTRRDRASAVRFIISEKMGLAIQKNKLERKEDDETEESGDESKVVSKPKKKEGKKEKRYVEYLNIYINQGARNASDLEKFREIACKLISYYMQNVDDVIKHYFSPRFFPDVDKILRLEYKVKTSSVSDRGREMLKDLNPDMYLSRYARFCQKPPEIVGYPADNRNLTAKPQEIKDFEEETGRQTYLFPKTESEGRRAYYACTGGEPYMQLKTNTLDNNAKYPVLPCCGSKDDYNNPKTITFKYFHENLRLEDLDVGELNVRTSHNYIIITNKILLANQINFPIVSDINKLLSSCYSSYQYLRVGVTRSVNSALECMISSLSTLNVEGSEFEKGNFLERSGGRLPLSLKTRNKVIFRVRKDIGRFFLENDVGIYQESFVYTRQGLIEVLSDHTKYLDPKLFIRLLELYFACKIFLFEHNHENPDGRMTAPYFMKEYLERPTVPQAFIFLYENDGLESDNLKYPQCEILGCVSETKDVKIATPRLCFSMATEKHGVLYRNLQSYFLKLYQSPYMFNGKKYKYVEHTSGPTENLPVSESLLLPFNEKDVKFQIIDYFGKSRVFIVKLKNIHEDVPVICRPFYNLNVALTESYSPCSLRAARLFTRSVINSSSDGKGVEFEKIVNADKVIGISFIFNGNVFYIKTIPEEFEVVRGTVNVTDLKSLPFSFDDSFPLSLEDTQKSVLQQYSDMNRSARNLSEYFLYFYSLFLKSSGFREDSEILVADQTLQEFKDQRLYFIPDFVYPRIPRIFSLESKYIKNGKLIISSENLFKKLVYFLKLSMSHGKSRIYNYSNYIYIQNYFKNVNDFVVQQDANYRILQSQESLLNWIDFTPQNYSVQNKILDTKIDILYNKIKHIYPDSENKSMVYIVLFGADWSLTSKRIRHLIYNDEKKHLSQQEINRFISFIYRHKAKFFYINIEKNFGLKTIFSVSIVPTLISFTIENDKLVEKGRFVYNSEKSDEAVNEARDFITSTLDNEE